MDISTSPRRTPTGQWVAATTELKSQGWGRSLRRHRMQAAIGQFVSQFNAPKETEASEAASDRDENTSGTITPIYSEKFETRQGEFCAPSFQLPGGAWIATDTFVSCLVTFGSFRGPTVPLGTDQILAPLAGNGNTYPGMTVTCGECLREIDVSQSRPYSPPSVSTFSPGGYFGLSLGASLFIRGFYQEISRKFSPKTNSNRATLFKASLCFSLLGRMAILSLNPPRAPC
jgi:hypothetical protein